MTNRQAIGLALTLAAGLLSGNCMLPMKYARRWPWEATWLLFSLISLLVLPCALALALVKNLFTIYGSLDAASLLVPVLFGAGWGVAQVLFGLSVARLGMALGYSLIVGLGALLGTLIPLFVSHADIARSRQGAIIFIGVAIMLFGIAVVGWAGGKRERRTAVSGKSSYAGALSLAILCGLMAPMLNYAFAFGESISHRAVTLGNSPEASGYAIWPIALLGGLVPNLAYSLFLLSRNQTWRSLASGWQTDSWCGALMAVLWMGAFAIYGVSSTYLGVLGTSAGWALFQIFMIVSANCSGLLTAEWKGAPGVAKWGMGAGLAMLCGATVLIAPRG